MLRKGKKRTGGGYETYLSKEQKEHSKIVEFIRWNPKTKNTLWFHTSNEGKRTPFEQFLWNVMGCRKGVSDFIFLAPRGAYHGLIFEHKPIGTLVYKRNGSCYFPDQDAFIQQAKSDGYRAEFTVGIDAAIDLLREYFEI